MPEHGPASAKAAKSFSVCSNVHSKFDVGIANARSMCIVAAETDSCDHFQTHAWMLPVPACNAAS